MSIKGIETLTRAITNYTPSLSGVTKLVEAAFKSGELELQRGCEGLKKLVGAKGGKPVGASRFARKAQDVYPSKGEVVANLLLSLYTSTGSKAKELARELAAAVFKDVAKDVPIYGKYV